MKKRSLFTPEQRRHIKLKLPGPPPPTPPPPAPLTVDSPQPQVPRFVRKERPQGGGAPSINLTGKRFGKWEVIGMTGRTVYKGKPVGPSLWKCKCDCGKIKDKVLYTSLTSGQSQSCGCIRKKQLSDRATHRQSASKEYHIWQSMKTRCFNSRHHSYRRYGARGVTVCPEWVDDFEAFFEYMGPIPPDKDSIDRWPNRRGNYEPGNCRWATYLEQADNRDSGNRQLNLAGQEFDMLTALNIRRCSGHQTIWNCRCACGEDVPILHRHLMQGKARSCGCHRGQPRMFECPDFHDFTVKRPDVSARRKKKIATKE